MKLEEIKNSLPDDYLDFLKNQEFDIMENELNYMILWYEHELIEFNTDYQDLDSAPNLFFIGGNGGGAGIAFNLIDKKLYSVPFIGLDENDASLLADNFSQLLEKFENEELEIY